MRLKLTFTSEKEIFLPLGYFSIVQGLIYNLFDKLSADWLHSEGFKYKNTFFKMFVFSEINENAKFFKGKGFLFPQKISFFVASPLQGMLEEIAKNVLVNENLFLGRNSVTLNSIIPYKTNNILNKSVIVRTLSPIEVHSTFKTATGSSKSYFFHYQEPEFSGFIEQNLQKKWEILNGKPCPYKIQITPLSRNGIKKKVIIVKGSVVQGWKGRFRLEGDLPLIKLALDSGLGSRNSLGFGMIELSDFGENEGVS